MIWELWLVNGKITEIVNKRGILINACSWDSRNTQRKLVACCRSSSSSSSSSGSSSSGSGSSSSRSSSSSGGSSISSSISSGSSSSSTSSSSSSSSSSSGRTITQWAHFTVVIRVVAVVAVSEWCWLLFQGKLPASATKYTTVSGESNINLVGQALRLLIMLYKISKSIAINNLISKNCVWMCDENTILLSINIDPYDIRMCMHALNKSSMHSHDITIHKSQGMGKIFSTQMSFEIVMYTHLNYVQQVAWTMGHKHWCDKWYKLFEIARGKSLASHQLRGVRKDQERDND